MNSCDEDVDEMMKRRYIRYMPGTTTCARVCFDAIAGADGFRTDAYALVIDISAMGGCGLAMLKTDRLQIGDRCLVDADGLDPLVAEVRWRKQVDDDILKIGLAFI